MRTAEEDSDGLARQVSSVNRGCRVRPGEPDGDIIRARRRMNLERGSPGSVLAYQRQVVLEALRADVFLLRRRRSAVPPLLKLSCMSAHVADDGGPDSFLAHRLLLADVPDQITKCRSRCSAARQQN